MSKSRQGYICQNRLHCQIYYGTLILVFANQCKFHTILHRFLFLTPSIAISLSIPISFLFMCYLTCRPKTCSCNMTYVVWFYRLLSLSVSLPVYELPHFSHDDLFKSMVFVVFFYIFPSLSLGLVVSISPHPLAHNCNLP